MLLNKTIKYLSVPDMKRFIGLKIINRMKKHTIISVIATFNFALLTLNCIAQPNGGFENWSSQLNYENPDQ